ncbi:MAG: dihydrodipicolinate synthase family protein [Acidobacteria bacterium]|nr:dihydrodipicolinate synthase family protein [Acidobacteriota bacterium]
MIKLQGCITPIGTPLTDGDRVDEAGLRRLARYLLDGGVDAVFSNGGMGGFAFLTADEQIRSIATTVDEVNGRVPVLGGVGETSTSRAVEMVKRVAAQGVDCITVLPPFYYLATQDHLYAYFSEVAAATDLPLVIYDNPVLSKNPVHPATLARLREAVPHLVGVKISNSDYANLQEILRLTPPGPSFSVLTGHEFLILVALQMGCDGFVGGLHNICPHLAVHLYDAFRAGDMALAKKLQQDLIETWQIFRRGSIWGAFDEALRHLGLCDRATGRPYVTAMTDQEKQEVHDILDRYVKPYLIRPPQAPLLH